ERLVQWWGPRGFTTPCCEMDVRPGGAFRFGMRSPQGTDHRLRGVFRAIAEPERLVCTWTWGDPEGKPGQEALLTVTFAERDGKTTLTLRQAVFESVTSRDAHNEGWGSSLDCLGEYLTRA